MRDEAAGAEREASVTDGGDAPVGYASPKTGLAPPPRVWPAVVLVALIWAWVGVMAVADLSMMGKFMGMMATTFLALLAFPIWWAADRTHRGERRLGVGAFVGFGILATLLAPLGVFPWLLLVLPWVFTTWMAWAVVSRRKAVAVRRRGLVVALALGWCALLLTRTEGLSGEGRWQLKWRWSRTAEEQAFANWSASSAKPSTTPTEGTATSATLHATDGDWPEFRGPKRDGAIRGVRIGTDWAKSPPKLLWKERVGPAWSSMTVVADRVFTQEQRGAAEAVVARDAASGREVWAHANAVRFTESMSGVGPRATPTFADGRLYTLGATGMLNCLDAATGAKIWSRDLIADAGAKVPIWGFASSPLVTDGKIIVFAGGPGENGLLAYDASTGTPAWKVAAGTNCYSSAEIADVAGERVVLFWGETTVVAVDPKTGAKRGQYDVGGQWGTLQPQVLGGGDTIVLVSDSASTAIRVKRDGDKWATESLWKSSLFRPQFNDFVVNDGYAYGLIGGNACCIDLATGKQKWRKGRYGYGQLALLADQGLLVIASESGEVALVAAKPERHEELARIEAVSGKTWAHPTIAHGRLYVRSDEEMACFELPPARATTEPSR
jgi:outer membrane protein assembly factor BamB